MKRDNSACNLAGYRVDDPRSILGKGRNIFLFHEVQTASGCTQPPIQSVSIGHLGLLLQWQCGRA
jgi:hypothetical protein